MVREQTQSNYELDTIIKTRTCSFQNEMLPVKTMKEMNQLYSI
jgi:hypothetical protein